ncbi:3-hydroxyacyl-ACP dehydratase [Fluviicola chungangensis]|uniref:3-hydroxyacyl-ACP dehydratase n=1 Tax=Fluviicola chungangensis TaxID=2597671 RepID=A0A556N348_9FLAO|nr:3-hydroxyacyl-ACP dehydratase [Fluviicola chungangensis]TSJ46458.1 3-hydroxyacyl-ACP dehydratase [Fluviicola chungangensis]
MILKDTFYTINALTFKDNILEATFTIDAKHPIYKGHFPGNPVTPGVVQLELVKEILGTQFNRVIQLKTLATSKFLAVLNPVNTPEATFKMTVTEQEGQNLKVSGQLSTSEGVCLKFSGIYY